MSFDNYLVMIESPGDKGIPFADDDGNRVLSHRTVLHSKMEAVDLMMKYARSIRDYHGRSFTASIRGVELDDGRPTHFSVEGIRVFQDIESYLKELENARVELHFPSETVYLMTFDQI